jgi:hypothetical protein
LLQANNAAQRRTSETRCEGFGGDAVHPDRHNDELAVGLIGPTNRQELVFDLDLGETEPQRFEQVIAIENNTGAGVTFGTLTAYFSVTKKRDAGNY